MNKIILILSALSFIFCQITKIETSYKDSTTVVQFHKNGKVKAKGVKINRFKHGKWLYYDDKGILDKVEKFHHGRKVQ